MNTEQLILNIILWSIVVGFAYWRGYADCRKKNNARKN